MTQLSRWMTTCFALLALGVSVAWAEEKKATGCKCCCDRGDAPAACCDKEKKTIGLAFDFAFGLAKPENGEKCCKQGECCKDEKCCAEGECCAQAKEAIKAKQAAAMKRVMVRLHPCGDLLPDLPEQRLVRAIKNTIQPDGWTDKGGTGTVEYFPRGMALVINSTPDVHEQVSELMQALRHLPKEKLRTIGTPSEKYAFEVLPSPVPVFTPPLPAPPMTPVGYIMQTTVNGDTLVNLPSPPPLTPETYHPGMAMGYQAVAYPMAAPPPTVMAPVMASPPTPRAWHLRALTRDGKTCVQVHGPEADMTCENMELKLHGSMPVAICVTGKQICIKGKGIEACCDALHCTSQTDCVTLEGNVRLMSSQPKMHAEISGGQVTVNFKDGHVVEWKVIGTGSMTARQ